MRLPEIDVLQKGLPNERRIGCTGCRLVTLWGTDILRAGGPCQQSFG